MKEQGYSLHVNIPLSFLAIFIMLLSLWGRCYGTHFNDDDISKAFPRASQDIVFVIDNSGSMKTNDPQFITKEVVRNFAENLPTESRLGMVIFDEDTRLLQPLTEKGDSETYTVLIERLAQVNYQGLFTDSPAGIERAIYELKTHGRDSAQKIIIFLTDGIVDTGNRQRDIEREKWLLNNLAEESEKAGIRIFGIAFTEKADVRLVHTLALKTNGEYFRVYEAADITGVFVKINEIIGKATIQAFPSILPLPVPQRPKPVVPEPEPSLLTDLKSDPSTGAEPVAPQFPLKSAIVATVLALLGIVLVVRYFKKKSDRRLKKENADPIPYHLLGENKPVAKLIDQKNVSTKGSAPFVLDKARVTIGRDRSNDIIIPDKTISGFHATIEFKDSFFCLEDLRSTNGTYLNRQKIYPGKPVKLKSGDKLFFGGHEFRFVVRGQLHVGETISAKESILPEETAKLQKKSVRKKPIDDVRIFKDCLVMNLQRIKNTGSTHKRFIEENFKEVIVGMLSSKAKAIMTKTQTDRHQYSDTLTIPPNLFYLCSIPVDIEQARTWFSNNHGGYMKFLSEILDSIDSKSRGIKTLCLIIYGRAKIGWVSITIISPDEANGAVDIMPNELLTEEERQNIR